MKARGALAILVCAMAALALPAGAVAKPGYYVSPPSFFSSFDLRGSNGYSIHVFGLSGNRVWIVASMGAGSASYLGRGKVTPDSVEGRFGSLGRVSVQFEPAWTERQGVRDGCKGKPASNRQGRFTGLIRFRGEEGFTSVDAAGARGFAYRTYRTVCKRPRGERPPPDGKPPTTSLSAVSSRYPSAPWFSVFKQEPPKRSRFALSLEDANYTVRTIERRPNLGIYRTVSARSSPETFAVTPLGTSPATATVDPPAPFSGTATYEKTPEGKPTWTGDLTVELPGRGELSLTDPTYHATLCRNFACACPIGECLFVSVTVAEGRAERLRRLAARAQP